MSAVRESNVNVGGNVLESNGAWLIVRGVGLVTSMDDLRKIVIGASNGTPVYVEQVANVQVGDGFRVSALVKGTKEAVGGVVVARTGVNTKNLIDAVKARIAQIQPGLPEGVTIVPFYDRSTLIEQASGTLRRALVEEIILVTLAHVIFLMHFRSILIVTIPLPLAVLISFLGMYYAGISSNIMSLAGIAIAIGVLVDAGIVVTENAFRFLEQRAVDPRDRRLVWETVLESTRLVGRPVFFSMAIILLAFIPVFALTGQEGKLFHPLAFAKTFAVLAATVVAVTLVPVLCSLLLGGKVHKEDDNPFMRGLRRLYRPALDAALAHRAFTVAAAAALFVGALLLARGIGSEFMPPLNEGDLMFMPIADPSISLDENTKIAAKQNADPPVVPGGRIRGGEGGARGHLHGPRAAEHDGDGRPPQAARAVASGDDPGPAPCRDEPRRAVARRLAHLDDADHQPDRHAHHRHPIRSGREDFRRGPDDPRDPCEAGGRGGADGARDRHRLSRTGDERPVPEHRGRPRRRRPIWDWGERRAAGDRDGDWRDAC